MYFPLRAAGIHDRNEIGRARRYVGRAVGNCPSCRCGDRTRFGNHEVRLVRGPA